jgi:hypothetical protein
MSYIFAIFSVVGWLWAVGFIACLLVRNRKRDNVRGFGVVMHHEK